MLVRSVRTSHTCNFHGRICGNESQPGLQLVKKTGYAPPLNYSSSIKGQYLISAFAGW